MSPRLLLILSPLIIVLGTLLVVATPRQKAIPEVVIPSFFPGDVPRRNSWIPQAYQGEERGDFFAMFETDEETSNVLTFVRDTLREEGWHFQKTTPLGDSVTFTVKKGSRSMTATVARYRGKTTILYSQVSE